MKFTELLCQWKQRRRTQLALKTAGNMEAMYVRWRTHFGCMEVEEVTPAHIEAYRLLRDDGTRGGSILNQERAELNAIFRHAVDLQLIASSPVTTWKCARVEVKKQYVVLSKEEEIQLCMNIHSGFLARYVVFACATGLRQGTIRAIRANWINTARRTLTVPAEHMKTRKQLSIPLSDQAWNQLTWGRADERLMPIPSQQKIHREVQAAARKAGLPASLCPHDFRRTWVARMRDAGAEMVDVMRLGGWSSPSVMLKHYFGEVPEKRARALLEAI